MYDRWMVKLFENINHRLARLSSDITGHSMFLAGFNFFVIWLFEQLTVFSLKWQNSCSKRCMFYFRRSSHISQEAKHPWQQKKHDKKKLVETPLLQNCKAMKPFRDRTITCSIFCYGEEKKESWSQKLLRDVEKHYFCGTALSHCPEKSTHDVPWILVKDVLRGGAFGDVRDWEFEWWFQRLTHLQRPDQIKHQTEWKKYLSETKSTKELSKRCRFLGDWRRTENKAEE